MPLRSAPSFAAPQEQASSALAFLSADDRLAISRALRLSPREATIVTLVLSDAHEEDIANTLGISKHTVHTHLDRIYRKLNVHSRCQLALRLFATYAASVTSTGTTAL